MRTILLGLGLSLMLALGGGAPRHSSPSYTVADVKAALEQAGLSVVEGIFDPEVWIFGAPVQELLVNGERIHVYTYPDRRTAWGTVDVDRWEVYSVHSPPLMITPMQGVIYRNLRPGNLVIRMAMADRDLVDRITQAIHDWAGAAPGEVKPERPSGPRPPESGLTEQDVLAAVQQEFRDAQITGELRTGGPGGLTGRVIQTEYGRYIVYIFPDRQAQEQAEVPLWPTASARTIYLRHGNLIVAMEADLYENPLVLELGLRHLPAVDAPESGIVEQEFDLTFLRPVATFPTQSAEGPEFLSWESFNLVRPYLESLQHLQRPNRLVTLEEAAADRVAGFGGTVLSSEPATFAEMPATRTVFKRADGTERVLYTARRAQSFYNLDGPAHVVDRIVYRAEPAWQYPYRADHIRRVFAQAGIEVPLPMELDMEGHKILFSISSGLYRGFGNLELYGLEDAPHHVQERLWAALSPLRFGWGQPVWEFGCDQPPGAPTTGGTVRTGSLISLCARPEPATFTLVEAETPGALRTVLDFQPANGERGHIRVVVRRGDELVADVQGALPLAVKVPYTGLGSIVTVTGEAKLLGRVTTVDADGQDVTPGSPPSMGAVPYRYEHVTRLLQEAGLRVMDGGLSAPELLPHFPGTLLRIEGEQVYLYLFPDRSSLGQLEISPDGRSLSIGGGTFPAPWEEGARIIRVHNLLLVLGPGESDLAGRIESIFK